MVKYSNSISDLSLENVVHFQQCFTALSMNGIMNLTEGDYCYSKAIRQMPELASE